LSVPSPAIWYQFLFHFEVSINLIFSAVISLSGMTVVSTSHQKQVAKTPQCLSKIVISYLKGVCDCLEQLTGINYSTCAT